MNNEEMKNNKVKKEKRVNKERKHKLIIEVGIIALLFLLPLFSSRFIRIM